MNGTIEERPFAEAAAQVVQRLTRCRWVEAMRRTALPVLLGGLVLLALLRWAGRDWFDLMGAGLVIALWAGGCALWAKWRQPKAFSALALWDERAGRHEEFASAWFFEGKAADDLAEGERLHLAQSRTHLGKALATMRMDLPMPKMTWQWVLPVLLVLFAMSPLLKPVLEAGDRLLTDEMQEKAQDEADDMKLDTKEFEKMASLDEKEKKDIEQLKNDINATADDLKDSADKTAREVLRELEARARAAEKLAERLGDRGEEWASEEMLKEMSQHADTADLAAAIKDKKADESADESERIAGKLKDEELANDASERMETALDRTMKKATDADHKRPVGRHVGEAAVDMRGGRPPEASHEFQKLADHFRRVDERERAQKKLKEMAKKLRESGANIAGKGAGSMEKLAGTKSQAGSMSSPQMSPSQMPNMTPMTGQSPSQMGQGQGQSMPMPGLKPQKGQGQGQGSKGMARAPVPGSMKPGQAMGFMPGGSGGTKAAAMMAPIPGSGMMAGGNQAGHGTAPMGQVESQAMKSNQSGLVAAQVNRDGESTVRAVEGGQRAEEAARDSAEQIVEFIKVEEEALDEKPLPSSRREHILRYFTALRERFEDESR